MPSMADTGYIVHRLHRRRVVEAGRGRTVTGAATPKGGPAPASGALSGGPPAGLRRLQRAQGAGQAMGVRGDRRTICARRPRSHARSLKGSSPDDPLAAEPGSAGAARLALERLGRVLYVDLFGELLEPKAQL